MVYVKQVLSDPKAREKPCLRCELSLRPHLDERFCPRCGLSVWMSLNANDSLDYSNPRWLRAAVRGAWFLAAAQFIALAAYVLAMVGGFELLRTEVQSISAMQNGEMYEAESVTEPTTQSDDEEDWGSNYPKPMLSVPAAMSVTTIGLYFIANSAALVMLTVHERRYPDRMKTVRNASRISAGAAAGLGAMLILVSTPNLKSGWPVGSIWSMATLFAVEVAFAVCACCAWMWLKRIAHRGGQSGLSKLFGYLLFLPALALLKAMPCFGLWFLYFLSPLLKLLPIVYIPLSIYLIVRCALLLQRAAPNAEAAWAKESKPASIP